MARKLTRQQAMLEAIDALCPAGPDLRFSDAMKLAAVCEEVAKLYDQGGKMVNHGLGLSVTPASLKDAFWAAARAPGIQKAHEEMEELKAASARRKKPPAGL